MSEARERRNTFRPLLLRALILPVVCLACLAGVMTWQVTRLIAVSEAADQTDRVISRSNELQRLCVDMETGLRGYLITKDRAFLEPYEKALPVAGPLTDRLVVLLAEYPTQLEHLGNIRRMREEWVGYSKQQIAARDADRDYATLVRAGEGKRRMDAIRTEFEEMIGFEEGIRDNRNAATRDAATRTLVITGVFAIVIGLVLAFLGRRQFSILITTYEAALTEANDLATTLEKRVAERTSELKEANGELEAFSYSVSHDLRAPLRHISGFAELVKRRIGKNVDAETAENLETVQTTARKAGVMVDELLAFSRIGRSQIRNMPVDLAEILEEVRKDLEPETKRREIEWVVADLPKVNADPGLMRLVVQNLVSNAVKYTGRRERARIEIGCRCEDGFTVCYVRDNGTGFDMRYVDKLFGVFQRLHRSEDFEGIGIGLATVRRIVARHGGRVWAEGVVDQGATFYFSLPLPDNQNHVPHGT